MIESILSEFGYYLKKLLSFRQEFSLLDPGHMAGFY
jgi:hypothetical protein